MGFNIFCSNGWPGAKFGVESLRATVKGMEQQMQKALERIDQLEKEKSSSSARIGEVEKSVQAVQSAPTALNPSMGLVLDANVRNLGKAGGNFDFRSAELGIAASVDPFARMYSFINGTKDGVEIDEAAAITSSLPYNLTVKAGRFLADFGRFPKVHEHELPFVNDPLSVQRMIGGETQADGVEVNYLFPTPFFLRATLGSITRSARIMIKSAIASRAHGANLHTSAGSAVISI